MTHWKVEMPFLYCHRLRKDAHHPVRRGQNQGRTEETVIVDRDIMTHIILRLL
jgi:hypothetical protein